MNENSDSREVDMQGRGDRHNDIVWLGYVLGALLIAALTLLNIVLEPLLPGVYLRIPYVLAIGLVGYLYGFGPAMLALVLGFIGFNIVYIDPRYSLWPLGRTTGDWAQLGIFVVGSLIAGIAMSSLHDARRAILERSAQLEEEIVVRRRAETEAIEQSRKLQEQAQIVDLGQVLIRDMEGKIILWTTGDEQLYGYSKAEAMGCISHELLQTVFPVPLPNVEASVMRTGHWEGELVQTRRDDERISVASHWVMYRDAEGNPAGMLEVNNDITELKRAEEEIRKLNETLEQRVRQRTAELEASNKELESFSYSVSHDLRAPLRAIDGFSSALLRNYKDSLDSRGQDYLERVRAAAQRMGELIDDILGLSRATRAEVRKETFSLSGLVEEIAGELQRTEPERKVEFSIEPDIRVDADPHLMGIAMRNLLGNAWKFTSTRELGKIRFSQVQQDGETVYCVSDNGVGFDAAYVDKLFTPFQRLHTEAEFPGTGIGLALVQRIIRKHGGRIWAESEVDRGATFCFTLR